MQLAVLRHYILYRMTKWDGNQPCQIVDLHVSIVSLHDDAAGALTCIVFLDHIQHAASLKCIGKCQELKVK